ncbi:MAG: LCP family protein [Candidatus Saccharibacteria bacterium]
MQENQPRRPQYIDGFIHNRQQRSVAYSKSRTAAAIPTLATNHPQPIPQPRPLGDFKSTPKTPSLSSTALPVKKNRFGRDRSKVNTLPANPVKRSWKRIAKRTALIVLALFVVSGGWLGWKVYRNTAKVFGNKNPLHILSAFKPVPLRGEGNGHVNILLAGNSADRSNASANGGDLTDSVMVVSINTKEHTAFMLSVPRDLWVNVPGLGHGKINTAGTANSFSENGYPSGAMGALEKTITDNLGINLNYYALVNYTAFKQSVDAVGGIDVNIQSEDPRGLYDPSFMKNEGGPLKLANGVQHLNGQTALDLARARGDPYNGKYGAYGFPKSDFDRTEHQRWMMLGLKDKIISAGTLSNPLKIGNLMDSIGDNVKTDFQLNELASLYYMMKDIKSSDIQSLSLNSADGKNLLANYNAPGGQSALIPAAGVDNFNDIQTYITKVLNSNRVSKEGATITVLNGGQIVGLAKREGDLLATKGLNVTQVGDAPSGVAATTIIDNSAGKKPETKKLLQSTFGNNFSTNAALAQQYPGDFIVILGANQQDVPAATASSTSATGD